MSRTVISGVMESANNLLLNRTGNVELEGKSRTLNCQLHAAQEPVLSAQSTLHVTLTYRWLWHKVEKFTEKTATYFSVFALRVYFGNTVGWDFQKALICKHSLNHKSTCDQSDCSMHSPTNTALLRFYVVSE